VKDIKLKNVQEACLDGIIKSFKEYNEWSEEKLWNAPESLLMVNIAKKIFKSKGKKYVTIEDNVKYILKMAERRNKGRLPEKMRPKGRFDIVLWSYDKYEEGLPVGIIEVKHNVKGFSRIKKDIDRLVSVLEQDSKIEFGITTFYIVCDNKSKHKEIVEQKIDKIFKQVKEYISTSNITITSDNKKIIKESEDNKSTSFAVLFTLEKNK